MKFSLIFQNSNMLFYSLRVRLFRKFKQNYNYHKVLWRAKKIKDTEKIIYADISNILLNRYLYSFLKFFHINGYTVYLPNDINSINILSKKTGEFQYASWLLEDGFVKFGLPDRKKSTIWLEAKNLSNDYYSTLINEADSKSSYHIPMCEYPFLYHSNNWEVSIAIEIPRKRSIFMIGNCDKRFYNTISNTGVFNLPTRYETAVFLYKKKYFKNLDSFEDLINFTSQETDEKLIIIDTSKKFEIDAVELKKVLTAFNYYLALPGIIIPNSHNLVEAMSVGCIPVLHESYADLMEPKLINDQNCFIYDSLEELDSIILKLFLLNEAKIKKMRKDVLFYYEQYLSPYAVVQKIENNKFDEIFIQAEAISLALFKNKID